MIRHCMGLTAVALLVASATLDAQRPRAHTSSSSITWSAGAGMSVPTGDLSNGAASGFHVQGTSAYHRLGLPVDLRAELAYHRFGEKDYTVAGARPGQTIAYAGKSSMIAGIVDASYALNTIGQVRPYLLGGPGVYNTRAELTRVGSPTTTSSETKVGLNVGGGMNFSFLGRRTYLEARYNHVDQAAWIPITLGIRL